MSDIKYIVKDPYGQREETLERAAPMRCSPLDRYLQERMIDREHADPEALGQAVVDFWNASLKPGESRREFVGIVGEG
jgi:hypothetical protein